MRFHSLAALLGAICRTKFGRQAAFYPKSQSAELLGLRLVLALALIIGGLAVLVWLIPAAPMTGDGQYYIQFVRNGLQHGASSWHERRLLGPLIVRALPLDAQDGFFILTTVSLGLTALLTWLAARDLVAGEWRALAAIPLLFGTWVVAPTLREFGR